jgi:hypothetical protein
MRTGQQLVTAAAEFIGAVVALGPPFLQNATVFELVSNIGINRCGWQGVRFHEHCGVSTVTLSVEE